MDRKQHKPLTKKERKKPQKGNPLGKSIMQRQALHDFIRKSLVPAKENEGKGLGFRLKNEGFRTPSGETDIGLASSLMSPNTVYRFKLQGFSTIVATAGSIVNVAIPFDPSSNGFNFSEWSALSGLFDEVRLYSFGVQACTYANTTVSLVNAPLLIGTNLTVSTAPGTEGPVATLTDAKYHPTAITNAMGWAHTFVNKGEIGWSLTSSVTVTPYAGCPGSFQLYSAAQTAASNVAKVLVWGIYDLRARA